MPRFIFLLLLLLKVAVFGQILHLKPGWQLLGASEDIDPHIFSQKCIKFVWSYDAKEGWKVYINDNKTYDLPFDIMQLSLIKRGSGFWVESRYSCDINGSTITSQDLNSTIYPTNFYPIKSHPRLWLNKEILQNIQKQKETNSNEWQNFKVMCDSIIDSDTSNDPYGLDISPQNFTAPLALMYLLTKDNRYADKAMELMDKVSLDLSLYGDPDQQSFYFMALTYDWLYKYPNMTQIKKDAYHKKMRALSDKFWNEYNINASGTDSDNNLLTGLLHLIFGAAFYGDYDDAKIMLDRGWYGWSRGYYTQRGISNKDIIKAGLGGIYFTGMAYFPSTDIIGISGYEMTLKSMGYNINVIDKELKPFWSNTIYSIIALTEPTRQKIYDYGSWQDPNTLNTQPWLVRAMKILSFFALQSGDNTAASLAKGYAQNVDIGYENDPFLELFFDLPDLNAISPYDIHLPLIRFAKSPDFLLFRDSWDTNASWGVFRGDGFVPLDQQAADQGHFSLWYGDSYLTKGARNYEALLHGDFFNTLSIQNDCSYNGINCSGNSIFDSQEPAAITRVKISQQHPLFAYSMLKADGQWDENPLNYAAIDYVKTYRRHFFWTPRYVVVFDRVRTNTPRDVRYRLRALSEPIILGDTVMQYSQNGNYKLIQKTLLPKNITLKKIDESKLWSGVEDWIVDNSQRKWQTIFDINDTINVNILNVIQMGDKTMDSFDKLRLIEDSKNNGVKIGKWVVDFAKDETLRESVEYDINSSATDTYHLICDMKPGTYDLFINGVYLATREVKEEEKAIFFEINSTADLLNIKVEKH